MRRFRNILVVDGGEREHRAALRRAAALAETNQAELTVAAPTEKVLDEILRRIEQDRHDLLVKAAEGSPLDRQLLRTCPCPVWLVKPTRLRHHHRVLAAVNPMHVDPVHRELDHTVMQLASSLASDDRSELHVASAWSVDGEGALVGSYSDISIAELEALRADYRATALARVEALAARYRSPLARRTAVHLERGDPGEVLPRLVRRERIDLVVMGTVARRGVAGLVVGNTSEQVLDGLDCSVLVAKPPGFPRVARLTG